MSVSKFVWAESPNCVGGALCVWAKYCVSESVSVSKFVWAEKLGWSTLCTLNCVGGEPYAWAECG